jgi:LacI family transcriptional regulator
VTPPSNPLGPRPSIKEVAERAGVAISSVSRVLSRQKEVSVAMQDRVYKAVKELGYRPNVLARSLRSKRSMSIGFAVADIGNPIFADIVEGAERELRAAGYSLILTNSEGDPNLDADNIRLLEDRRVDGLLLAMAVETRSEVIEVLRESKLPIVMLDRDTPEGLPVLSAHFDHKIGMVEAVTHLLELGHRDFALIIGGPALPARLRRAAVEETLWEKGGRCITVEGGFGVGGGYRAAKTILGRSPLPTAIIAAGNTLMAGALRALHESRIRIGEDISFVGCDNVLVAELHDPPIAVIQRNAAELGEKAAGMLLAALTDDDPRSFRAEPTVLPTRFMPRISCMPPRHR